MRSILMILSFVVGGLLHEQLAPWQGWLRFGIAIMLTVSFIGLDVSRLKPRRMHLVLLLALQGIGLGSCLLARAAGCPILAESLYYCGGAPVAAAIPVIINLLRADVEFATTAMVLSHAVFALVTPLVLPLVVHDPQMGYAELALLVAQQLATVLAAPAIISVALRYFYPPCKAWAPKLRDFSLGIWIFNLSIISASGTHRVIMMGYNWADMAPMAIGAAVICAFGFLFGYRLGYPDLKRECSQILGQKNTILTLYIAGQPYATPLAYIGPVFYVFYHNFANAVQLSLAERERKRNAQQKEKA